MVTYHDTIQTHRCTGSLAQTISIHLCDPYPNLERYAGHHWWLLKTEHDLDYDSWYLHPVCMIHVCPFCGEKLTT